MKDSMMSSEPQDLNTEKTQGEVTHLLAEWSKGEPGALDRLFPLIYDELRRLAQHHMRSERSEHTLQRTALVHEAFIRLVQQRQRIESRGLFFSLASRVMRRVLLDHARSRLAEKRGAGAVIVSLDGMMFEPGDGGTDHPTGSTLTGNDQIQDHNEDHLNLVAIDAALTRLEAIDPQQAKVVELRFYAGLSIEEAAEALSISAATVKRDWAVAKLWLKRELAEVELPN